MEHIPDPQRSSRRFGWTIGLAGGTACLALASALVRTDDLLPLPLVDRDLAVGCLAVGQVAPPLDEWSDEELDRIVAIVARLQRSYSQADFEAFLALRSGGLAQAHRVDEHRVAEMRALALRLGAADEVPDDWIGALRSFWEAYYEWPPVARWLPEMTRCLLRERNLDHESLVEWNTSFVNLRDELSFCESGKQLTEGLYVDHKLTLSHPRSPAALVLQQARLRWFDLVLGFETPEGAEGRLLVRFVLDPIADEWFLQRAASALWNEPPLPPDVRQLIL